jgi:hypothetical protein
MFSLLALAFLQAEATLSGNITIQTAIVNDKKSTLTSG